MIISYSRSKKRNDASTISLPSRMTRVRPHRSLSRTALPTVAACAACAVGVTSAFVHPLSRPPLPAATSASSFVPAPAFAFHVSSSSETRIRMSWGGGKTHSPLEDDPTLQGESYFDALQEAAKDPAKFQEFVLLGKERHGGDAAAASSASPVSMKGGENANPNKKKGGYKPIEVWDEELKSRKDGSGMTWEERVQFDGQRNGNQVRQNDILNHHLGTF